MKKLLVLLGTIMVTGNAIPSIIATAPNKKHIIKKRQMPKKYKPLHELITVIDLGELRDNYEDTILHAITRLNPNISVDEIRIVQIPSNSRALIARSDATNSVGINDDVVWVRFVILSEGIIGNSRFYLESNRIKKEPIYEKILNKNQKKIIQRPKEAPPAPPTIKKEPIYATVLPKNQRNKKNNIELRIPLRNLSNIWLNTNLGELPDNLPDTILNRFVELNNSINRNQISISNITNISAIIISNENSRYIGNLEVFFTLNYKDKKNLSKIIDSEKDNDSNSNNKQKIQDIIAKFNNLSRQSKQQKLNEINQHYQNLSEDDKKVFKDKLTVIGTSAIGTGISVVGTKITVSGSASSTAVSTGEAIEMTPLLSEGLTAAETLSVAEGTAVVVATEGAIVGAEAGTAVALAPETLGLSLVIGGLAIAGTTIIWWLSSHDNNTQAVKHESHNQYNKIEKYYKFLSHDQLKLDINISEWNKIKQIYKENSNNYQEFKNKIKSEITNFHREDHSGWGGSITDDDINTLIDILYNHFQEINNYFLSIPNHGWKIITNTVGSYFIIKAVIL